VRGFLESDRTLNVLLWATIEAMQARPEMLLRAPYLAAVECGGEVVGACSLLPPNPLVVAPHTPREALPLLADDLLACGRAEQVTQMSGPVDVVEAFMALWRKRTGRGGAPVMRERLYRIDAAPDVPAVTGQFRPAVEADMELLLDWSLAFNAETWGEHLRVEREVLRGGVLARVQRRGGGIGLWVDGGEVVSLAGYGAGDPPAPARLAPVYTPPPLRGRGYGSAVTAALTRAVFDAGHAACMLFTDLSNPTSNHIYTAIGYRPVADWMHARFETA